MSKLEQYLSFVKEQEAVHEKLARRFESEQWRRDLHLRTAGQFASLAEDLIAAQKELSEARAKTAKAAKPSWQKLALSPKDLEGLPEDLLRELSISDADKLEFQIISLINGAGGILSLDRILIGLYKNTGEIYKRNAITSKLYRMVQKELLFSVPPKKGVYSTEEVSEEEAAKLFVDADAEPIEAACQNAS